MPTSKLARASRAIALLAAMAPCLSFADIILGHSGDLSGTSAALTKDYVRGMNAYFDEVNRKGGIRGEKIRLVSLDDGFNPDKPSDDDLNTPYGKLWSLLTTETDPNSDTSLVRRMSGAADDMGIAGIDE